MEDHQVYFNEGQLGTSESFSPDWSFDFQFQEALK